MPKIIYDGQPYECGDESVLECLAARGVAIPNSCRAGLCQTCMMQAVEGEVPGAAQAGLKPTLVAQNYFLACMCHPQHDMKVALPEEGMTTLQAHVASVEHLNQDVVGIRLKPSRRFEYKAGQFINFFKGADTVRTYSLASVPTLDDDLILHVRKVPGGLVSGWICGSLKAGDDITISEAAGDCFYVPGKPEQDIMLVGTGSGLAPLYGIIRDALSNRHAGKIRLYHGSYNMEGLYLVDELKKLSEAYENFRYVPCVSEGAAPQGYAPGMVLDVALEENPDLSGWRVFLCGNPDMVNVAKKQTFFAGASMRDIFADPF
jgi:ferredoxin-NADP reductase/ferredoxin